MTELPESLVSTIDLDPSSPLDVIVRVDGDLDSCEQHMATLGIAIRRRLPLIKGLAVTAPGTTLWDLADQPWVTHIEEDQQVRAL